MVTLLCRLGPGSHRALGDLVVQALYNRKEHGHRMYATEINPRR